MKYRVAVAGRSLEIEVEGEHLVRVNGQPMYVDLEQVGRLPVYSLAIGDGGYIVFLEAGEGNYQAEVGGHVYPVEVHKERPHPLPRQSQRPHGELTNAQICAPLAGNLVSLHVTAGERIEAGEVAAVVESMKMLMELKAPLAGVVEAVAGPAGRSVSQGEVLLSIASA